MYEKIVLVTRRTRLQELVEEKSAVTSRLHALRPESP